MKSFLSRLLRITAIQNILAFVAYAYIKIVYLTGKWKIQNVDIIESYIAQNKPFIISFWHGHLLMLAPAWKWKTPVHMLISNHRDGKMISKAMGHFGIHTISGSTDKKGFEAARTILQKLKMGHVIGITPDGPRGPREKVSLGIVHLAHLGFVDVIPVAYSCSPIKLLRSWDHFRIAKPFCKGVLVIGKPIQPIEDLGMLQAAIQASMDETVKIADEITGSNAQTV